MIAPQAGKRGFEAFHGAFLAMGDSVREQIHWRAHLSASQMQFISAALPYECSGGDLEFWAPHRPNCPRGKS
jgi:hypothetical protein